LFFFSKPCLSTCFINSKGEKGIVGAWTCSCRAGGTRGEQSRGASGSSAAPLATGHGHWDETSGCFYPAFVPEYQRRRDPTLLPSPARSGGCGMRRRRLGIERLKERTKKMNTASWPGARVPDSSPEKVTFKTGLSDSFDAAAFALGESSATRRCRAEEPVRVPEL
jgi:hypothetical protein